MKLSICIPYKYYFKNDAAPFNSVTLALIMMTSDDDDRPNDECNTIKFIPVSWYASFFLSIFLTSALILYREDRFIAIPRYRHLPSTLSKTGKIKTNSMQVGGCSEIRVLKTSLSQFYRYQLPPKRSYI